MTIAQIVELFLNTKVGAIITNDLMTEIIALIEKHERNVTHVRT